MKKLVSKQGVVIVKFPNRTPVVIGENGVEATEELLNHHTVKVFLAKGTLELVEEKPEKKVEEKPKAKRTKPKGK